MDCITKPVEGFDDYGRVWSEKSHKWLKPGLNKKGYFMVSLCHDGEYFTKKIHRLVAEAFIPNNDPKQNDTVDHIDGDKTNNEVSNLR